MPGDCLDCTRYIDARLDDHAAVHGAEHRALDAAAKANDSRFDGVNEFRAALGEQAGSFVTRSTLDALLAAQQVKLDSLQQQAIRSAIAAGVVSAILGLIGGIILVSLLRGAA